jgi:hypothetical protein
MADAETSTVIEGGTVQGVVGARTVNIENFTFYAAAQLPAEPPRETENQIAILPCPYPGLAYFSPADSGLFFGRGRAIARLEEAVDRQSLTALVGASGSGKSSVVLAGLAPRLNTQGNWRFTHFRIGDEPDKNPFRSLARALVPLFSDSSGQMPPFAEIEALSASLEKGREPGGVTLPNVLGECRTRNPGKRILLIADQFEEVFTFVEDEDARRCFIDVLLLGFPARADGNLPPICLVLTLRADFYGAALRYRPLADALQGHVENLGPMSREELREAIVKPAGAVTYETGLVETLLDEVTNRPGSLPLLQFALREMWGLQRDRCITRKIYDAIGGVEGALARRAQAIFDAQTRAGRDDHAVRLFQRVFLRMVTLGEGAEDTRRVVGRHELGEEGWALAQRLAGEDNRLVVTNAPTAASDQESSEVARGETAEVMHEALIRNWPTLTDWISRDRAFLSWQRQLKLRVDGWRNSPGDDDTLLRGGPLAVAEGWLGRRHSDLSDHEKAYIETSIARRETERQKAEKIRQAEIRRRRWVVAAGLAALLIGMFLSSIFLQRAEYTSQAKSKIIGVRNEWAINAFEGNFRRSLLLTLANLDATSAPEDLYEQFTSGIGQTHRETLGELRKILSRAPSFAGHYQAAGFDPSAGRLALLPHGEAQLRILKLRFGDGEQAEPDAYDLPAPALQNSMLRPVVGFVRGLGPVVLVNDHVYFWDDRRERHECDILPILPPNFRSGTWIRPEFIAGRLQLSVTERQIPSTEPQGRTSGLSVLRLDAADLRDCPSSIASRDPLRIPGRVGSQPVPAFSDAEGLPQRYGYLEETSGPAPNELAANLPPDPSRILPGKLVELDAVIGSTDQQEPPIRIAVGQVTPERGIPERAHYTLAFAANAQATVFKFDGPDFYAYDLTNLRNSNRLGYLDIPPQHIVVTSDLPNEGWRLLPSRIPSVYPPFAAAKVGQHWRAAWLAPNGIWVVESSDSDPSTAGLIFGIDAPLIGEPDGAKLQFTRDGEFLMLQRVQFPSQIFVRVWDLRPSWRAWIENPNRPEQELRAAACRVVRMEEGKGAFDEIALKLFQIDPAHQEPCPEP